MCVKVQIKCLTLEKPSPIFIVCLLYNYFCLYYTIAKRSKQEQSLIVLGHRRAYN